MPTPEILALLDATPAPPVAVGRARSAPPLAHLPGSISEAMATFIRTLDSGGALYAYVRGWLADDPEMPALRARPDLRGTMRPDGREGTLLSNGMDLATCITALGCTDHHGARTLREGLIAHRRAYLTQRVAYLAEAVEHPRRRKFDPLFARVSYTRGDATRLQSDLHAARAALDEGYELPGGDTRDRWLSWARTWLLTDVATRYVSEALIAGEHDDARALAALYWDSLTHPERARAARRLTAPALDRWGEWLRAGERASGSAVADLRRLVERPAPLGAAGAHWGTGDAFEAQVRRRVGFDASPIEGEIMIAADADIALARLQAYAAGRAGGEGHEWLIGVNADALPDILARLRAAGLAPRPVATGRRAWHGERFAALMLGATVSMRIDDQAVAVCFLAPVRRSRTAATTRAGLRRAIARTPDAGWFCELFGSRLDLVVIDRIASLPLPVGQFGLPIDADAPAIDLDDLAGSDACAHADAHWIACAVDRPHAHVALACPRCLRHRLDVVEVHRLATGSGFGFLDPARDDPEPDGVEEYLTALRFERALLGEPCAVDSWEALLAAEPAVDLAARAAAVATSGPAPRMTSAYAVSLEDALFG